MKNTFIYAVLCLLFCACKGDRAKEQSLDKEPQSSEAKTPSDWKKILTPNEYYIMVEKGTEPPFQQCIFRQPSEGNLCECRHRRTTF